jgi:thiol-disulfide isomerase/thioredoxin
MEGRFLIPSLNPNADYQLTARISEGDKVVMAGSTIKRPPNARILIVISEDLVSPATPKAPATPAADPPKPEPKPDTRSGASIGPPAPMKQDPPTPPTPTPPDPPKSGEVSVPEPPPVRVPRPDLKIEIPRRPPPLTIPPIRVGKAPDPSEPAPYSSQPLPIPSCIMLTSRQIDNFALYDTMNQPWEFKRDHKGRLILLDFWHTQCPPCLRAIGHLNELHQSYSSRGLEVIGIAYEKGTQDQRLRQVLAARSRFDIRYRILMSGDENALKRCPLFTQLAIEAYPTLKLIDEKGQIVWESMGLDDRKLAALKTEIERRLPLTR